ncbi:helix-turn-helix domain-containing protein [Nonomuraea wenchangensis]|uniref:helix-turn-helix domain-containing protein n=1 Tax=Nonomuraea wenchangensis TaxID=568860 RepID=UPI001C42EDFC|nr:helix-turn-helix domain-containing protein [Nonomuraea wenchangensis]
MKKFQPQPGFVVQAYRFALDPNVTQEAALRSHCGAARAAYNWAVSRESGRAGASACPGGSPAGSPPAPSASGLTGDT